MCAECARAKAKAWRAERAKDPEWRKRFNDANTVSRKATYLKNIAALEELVALGDWAKTILGE